jgi:hypothetical protein
MTTPLESFSFDKGINRKKKNRLLLGEGEVYACENFSYDHDGVLEARAARTSLATSYATINKIHRYEDDVITSSKALCPGSQSYFNYIYRRATAGTTYAKIDIMSGDIIPVSLDYQKFTFFVDDESEKRAISEGVSYKWGVDNPATAPLVIAGASGNPSGTYNCCVTFLVEWPNGKSYETGPSPVATITLTTDKVEWHQIPICPYESGTAGMIIYRRLYRSVDGIYYRVTTIENNTTTTYSDDLTDAALQLLTVLSTEGYGPPPAIITDMALHLQRVFAVYGDTLYWSEIYMPFAFDVNSNVVVTRADEDLVGCIAWGDQLWLVSKRRWYRLQGSSYATWNIKQTFTDSGVVNKHTLAQTKYGILGLWYDGIYIFDGMSNRNLTEKILGKEFFTDLEDLSVCYSEFDGRKYYFYYASTGSTLNACIVLDFGEYPDIRIYSDTFIAGGHFYYTETGHRYLGRTAIEYQETGSETIVTSLTTGDKVFGNIAQRKNLEYLYYDINTNSKDVTVTIYVDGVSAHTITLNTSSRTRARSGLFPGTAEGYRVSMKLDCADSQSLEIYAPWILQATLVGH